MTTELKITDEGDRIRIIADGIPFNIWVIGRMGANALSIKPIASFSG